MYRLESGSQVSMVNQLGIGDVWVGIFGTLANVCGLGSGFGVQEVRKRGRFPES